MLAQIEEISFLCVTRFTIYATYSMFDSVMSTFDTVILCSYLGEGAIPLGWCQ